MGEIKYAKPMKVKKLLYLIGIFIFGGMLLASIIDANLYVEKYSRAKLWEFRFFTVGSAIFYYLMVFILNKEIE
ncbi:hypothetical protein [Alkalihalobacterium elongatum]|uniref:hypothetical protein n=1 Tax=Alkalihalobacterium elongatum TaxID=2675466 RepID=UPI001C1F9BC2|nr:hypothetical protein [Alkalihalobacterium elongatum]